MADPQIPADPSPQTKPSAVRTFLNSVPRTRVSCSFDNHNITSVRRTPKLGRTARSVGQGRRKVKLIRRGVAVASRSGEPFTVRRRRCRLLITSNTSYGRSKETGMCTVLSGLASTEQMKLLLTRTSKGYFYKLCECEFFFWGGRG